MDDTSGNPMTWIKMGSIRDYDGTFGLGPSEQDLVCRSVEPACDLVDRLVHGTAWLACDRAVRRRPHQRKTKKNAKNKKDGKRGQGLGRRRWWWWWKTYVKAEYASETMPCAAWYAKSGA